MRERGCVREREREREREKGREREREREKEREMETKDLQRTKLCCAFLSLRRQLRCSVAPFFFVTFFLAKSLTVFDSRERRELIF